MRRFDKKKHMERVNKLFEERNLKESAFSWDGKYANEEVEEGMISLGNDIEDMDENCDKKENVEEEVTNITTDINDKTQFFSQEDGERRMDDDEK